MSHPDPGYDSDNSHEDDMNYDDYNDFHEMIEDGHGSIEDWPGECEDDNETWSDDIDDSMDGDHESGLTSCGWGTDEDYGYYGDDF